jgi:hypothetical protein
MFWKMVTRWALMAIAVPVAARVIREITQRIESRKGSTGLSRSLERAATGLDIVSRRRSKRSAAAPSTLS